MVRRGEGESSFLPAPDIRLGVTQLLEETEGLQQKAQGKERSMPWVPDSFPRERCKSYRFQGSDRHRTDAGITAGSPGRRRQDGWRSERSQPFFDYFPLDYPMDYPPPLTPPFSTEGPENRGDKQSNGVTVG